MSEWKFLRIVGAALVLGGAFSSGAVAETASIPEARHDVGITADVQNALAKHWELSAANQIYVDTRDHVVYLSGLVYSSLDEDYAIELASKVPGVNRVVSTIGVEG